MSQAIQSFRPGCGVCSIHRDDASLAHFEIWRGEHWLLRHHPHPSPLIGWCLLDARRHFGGPADFNAAEAADWGCAVQRASLLVQQVSGCDRVYSIAFGEGARHLHLHLIPRFSGNSQTDAWAVADLYRAVQSKRCSAAADSEVDAWIQAARQLSIRLMC